jgi:hypothetical protein
MLEPEIKRIMEKSKDDIRKTEERVSNDFRLKKEEMISE